MKNGDNKVNEVDMHSTNDLVRPRNSNESLEAYVSYLSSKLLIVKDVAVKAYLVDIINSYNVYESLFNGSNNAVKKEDPNLDNEDEISFQHKLEEKLEALSALVSSTKVNTYEEVPSLEDIKLAQKNAINSTRGQDNKLAEVLVGDIIKIEPGAIIYDDNTMLGEGRILTLNDSKISFLVKVASYFEKGLDSDNAWHQLGMDITMDNYQDSSYQNIIHDLNMRCGYNPQQYCKICYITSYDQDNHRSINGIKGFIHSGNYKLIGNINAPEDEYTMVA